MQTNLRLAGSDTEQRLRERIAWLEATLETWQRFALLVPPDLATWPNGKLAWHAKILWAWLWKRNGCRLGKCAWDYVEAMRELGAPQTTVFNWLKTLEAARLLERLDNCTVRLHAVRDAKPAKGTPDGVHLADEPDPQGWFPFEGTDAAALFAAQPAASSSDRGSDHTAAGMDDQPPGRAFAAAGYSSGDPLRAPPPAPPPDAFPKVAPETETVPANFGNAPHSHSHRETSAAPSSSSSSEKETTVDVARARGAVSNSGTISGNGRGAGAPSTREREPATMGSAVAGAVSEMLARADDLAHAHHRKARKRSEIRSLLGSPEALRERVLIRVVDALDSNALPVEVLHKVLAYARKANNPGAHFVVSMRREFRRLGLDWPAPKSEGGTYGRT